jgi:hypothetical protein
MAYTVGTIKKTVVGDMRCFVLSITADAATQTVVTGLDRIYAHTIGVQSLSTGAVKVYANSGAGGTATQGVLGCSGFANGDVFYAVVYGV